MKGLLAQLVCVQGTVSIIALQLLANARHVAALKYDALS